MLALMRSAARDWWVPLSLFALALVVRAIAAAGVTFPTTEGSAYYLGVARNLVEGRGLVTDALWSYATPPLVLPKPAFELWLPMASLISAVPMLVLGATFSAAQWGSVVLGAAIAPLAWMVAREAAEACSLPGRRVAIVAAGSGVAVAVLGPFVVAATAPDSAAPFLVFGTLAAVLTPAALRARARTGGASKRWILPGVALGASLGLAYLSRQEAIWLGAAFLALLAVTARGLPSSDQVSSFAARVGPVLAGGFGVVGPWLLRQTLTFGTPFPGQALENAFLVRNEDIFAYTERPTLARFLGQGIPTILAHQAGALWHDLVTVVAIPAFPLGLIGLVSLVALRRSPALRTPSALAALLMSGLLTLLATALLFPVATLWGTFLHASGPLLVGLTVGAMLGLDALVARIGDVRGWSRGNAWLAPAAVLAVVVPLGVLQAGLASRQSAEAGARMTAVAAELAALPEVAAGPTDRSAPARRAQVVSDHPIWLAETLRRPVIALPDEAPTAVMQLARDFDATLLVVFDERGRYPGLLLGSTSTCLAAAPRQIGDAANPVWLFRLDAECGP